MFNGKDPSCFQPLVTLPRRSEAHEDTGSLVIELARSQAASQDLTVSQIAGHRACLPTSQEPGIWRSAAIDRTSTVPLHPTAHRYPLIFFKVIVITGPCIICTTHMI